MQTHQTLIDTLRKLPVDMDVRVSVQNAGVFARLTTVAAIELLYNSSPKWGLTIRDDGEHYGAFIFCDEGDGIGAYANPPTEDADGNPIET